MRFNRLLKENVLIPENWDAKVIYFNLKNTTYFEVFLESFLRRIF